MRLRRQAPGLLVLLLPATIAAQAPTATVDATAFYAPGFILQDRNGDDVIDFLHVRMVLPAAASEADVVAAASIAARLGYETSGLNLDFVAFDNERVNRYDAPVILIGAGNALAARATLPPRDGLAPGMGAITRVLPDDVFPAGGLLVEGGDATGLLEAAEYLSGRYPNIWGLRGATHADVRTRLERYLRHHGIRDARVSLDRIVVTAGRTGVASAFATVEVADAASFANALRVLRSDSVPVDSAAAAAAAPAAGDSAQRAPVRRREILVQDLHRLDVRVRWQSRAELVRILPLRPWEAPAAQPYTAGETPDFSLTELFSVGGLFRDTNQDLVPDRTDAYLSIHGAAAARSATALAARIGLETAGMRLPFASIAGQDEHPEAAGFPILFGVDHYQTERLRAEERLHTPTGEPGLGFIEFVPRGVNGRHALVISGSDSAGLRAITDHVAQRLPYLWEYGKGRMLLSELQTEVRRFFQARETAGQIALAGHKLRVWLDRLKDRPIDSLAIEIATKERPGGLDRWAITQAKARFPDATVTAGTWRTGFGEGRTIFTEDIEIPWEVDDFWRTFRERVLPALRPESRGRIEVRVSESPAIRARLTGEIRQALRRAGIAPDAFDIVVLSAYKQGYSWLHDVILPRLQQLTGAAAGDGAGASIGRIEITYHTLENSREVRWQEVESATRWLQEIYPIDAIFAKALGIPDSLITFTATHQPRPVYTVRVADRSGRELLRESFDPKYVVRPFFDLFPEYESVRVTTGWLHVTADGRTLVDERIVTDPERLWDHLQTQTYAKLIAYVMDVQDGRPSPSNAPYFDALRIELALSEPNYRIGIDEEVISSLEALHEDIYFETLTLFDLLGNRYGVDPLSYAGRVLPYIIPNQEGRPGRAKITLTGKERGVPELVLTWRERGREPVRQRYPLSPLPVDPPRLRGIAVREGQQEIRRLLFEIAVPDSVDRYEESRARAAEAQIDRTLLSAELLSGMTQVLADLQQNGILGDAVGIDRVAELTFRFVARDTAHPFTRTASLMRSRRPASSERPLLLARGYRYDGQRIVQWQTPIPPAENDSILAKLATFPGVNVYRVARSFLGKDIFAADFLPPYESRYISQAKLNALKPTLLLSGRQHANEVSSTSHILRLGELLVTDSAYRRLLNKVNVVLHPITNPDGAQVAWEMQLVNPDFMLHAGYLGALGVDATTGANSEDPIYPESRARPILSEMWLPDIFMNMHGYPSHEWVQYFAGYSGWVRGRRGTQRSWWAPRGWFVPGFSWVDDPRYPEIRQAQLAILDSIAAAITSLEPVEAMNRRMYARYRKYGTQDVENFREDFHNGILVYRALRGREATGSGTSNPRITYFAVTTEAPDETARGEWLELVASAGLAHSSALLRYLASGENRMERTTAENDRFVIRSVFRRKPVLPRKPTTSASR